MSPLTQKERDAVKKEIASEVERSVNAALSSFKPHGWRKVTFFLRDWGLSGTAISAPIALLALAATAFYQANARVEKQATFEATTTATLNGIKEHLDRLDVSVSSLQLERTAENPSETRNAISATKIIDRARKDDVQLPSDVVKETGARFVDASDHNPAAWDTAKTILEYVSFLNKQSSPLQTLTPFHGKGTFIELPHGWTGNYSWFGSSTYPNVPQFHPIGFGLDSNESIHEGPSFLVLSGAPLQLDGEVIKRVVFMDVEVIYDGGPLQMESVYFVNCTFKIKPSARSKSLAIAMLSPNESTTFSGE